MPSHTMEDSLRYSLLSAKRIRAAIGVGAVGAVAALAFVTPAFAADSLMEVRHSEKCNTQNRVEVTWGLKLTAQGAAANLDQNQFSVELTPEPSEQDWVDLSGTDVISADAWNESRQTLPAGTTKVALRITYPGDKGAVQELVNVTFDVSAVCSKPSASSSPTTSPSGSTLPVTGSSTIMIAGVAVVLLVVGAGVFFVARRRRVTFTA